MKLILLVCSKAIKKYRDMKKCNLFIAAILMNIAGVCVVSCSGSDDESQEPPVNTQIESVRIIADKEAIEADGLDKVTFSIVGNDGTDLTKNSYIKNVTTGTAWKKGINTFTHNENAIVKFTATSYNGKDKYMTDTIEVKVQNRKKYELYKKRIAVFKITGTWCINCPTMTTMLKDFDKTNPNTIIEMSFHGNSNLGTDPLHTDATVYLASAMGMGGFPSSVFDLNTSTLLTNPASSLFKETVNIQQANEPAICAIKVKTSLDEQKKEIYVDASLITDKGGEFELAYVLIQDGLVAEQTGATSDYVHNNTVVGITGNFLGGADKIKVKAGESYDFERVTMPMGYEAATKTRIYVYAIVKKNGVNVVNNIVECELGKEVDYEENAD